MDSIMREYVNMVMCFLWMYCWYHIALFPTSFLPLTSPPLTSLSIYIFSNNPSFFHTNRFIFIQFFDYLWYYRILLTRTPSGLCNLCDFQWKDWLSEHRVRRLSVLFLVSAAILSHDTVSSGCRRHRMRRRTPN